MILKAMLVTGTFGFGLVLGYWGYWVAHYTLNPIDNSEVEN